MKRRLLNPDDCEVTHLKGTGPGGQNKNKRFTGVRVKHLPTGLIAMATERRAQGQNLSHAMERLQEKLDQFYYRPEPRVATKATRGSKERRLTGKGVRSSIKKARGRYRGDD